MDISQGILAQLVFHIENIEDVFLFYFQDLIDDYVSLFDEMGDLISDEPDEEFLNKLASNISLLQLTDHFTDYIYRVLQDIIEKKIETECSGDYFSELLDEILEWNEIVIFGWISYFIQEEDGLEFGNY